MKQETKIKARTKTKLRQTKRKEEKQNKTKRKPEISERTFYSNFRFVEKIRLVRNEISPLAPQSPSPLLRWTNYGTNIPVILCSKIYSAESKVDLQVWVTHSFFKS